MKIQEQKISIFENATSTKQQQISLNQYFEGIQSGKWQDEVLKCRAITDKAKQDQFKKSKVKAVTASGLFLGRKDTDLSEHSGLLVIDIDDKDQSTPSDQIREQLKEMPELFAIHFSTRGSGLAAYFRIKKDKHFESFDAIVKVLVNDYGVVPDMHCSNIGRLRFVSYDPELYLNYGASVWNYFEKKENRVAEANYDNFIFSNSDIDYIISQIKERSLNIAPDYYSWLRIGFGLASKLGEGGRAAFRLVSSFYYDKQHINPDKQYDNCLKSEKARSGGISIKSFFYYAKIAGCNLNSERTNKIKTVAKIRRKQELSAGSGAMVNGRQDARQYLLEFEGYTGADVDEVLEQVWKLPVKDLSSEEGLLYDIEIFLKSNYKFRFNEITNIVEIDGVPMTDYIFNTMYLRVTRIVSDKATKDKIFDLIYSEFTPRYNPILEWFEKNKHVKTTGNITKLAECIKSNLSQDDPEFVAYFLEKWLLSIIASAHGLYSILCLVLTGQEQGTGKTNFFRELFPEVLRWLFSINKLDGKEADIGQLMCSKWLILDDEFGGKSKQDEKRFKELISKDKFTIRKPWGRNFEDLLRLAVLCGTTNEEQVINDLTGNRRIIPIQVNYIDELAFAAIDKTELFIELYWKYRENPKGFFFTKDDIDRLNRVCYGANQVAPEMELPLKYFSKATKEEPTAKFLSSSEIRSVIEIRSGIKLSQQKLSISLKNIGYNYEQRRVDGQVLRGFWLCEKFDSSPSTSSDTDTKPDELPF